MKRSKVLSFTVAFLLLMQSANVHVNDVLLINNLMEHLDFHESTYGDDIFAFLNKHYGSDKEGLDHDKENSHNHELPFTHNVCADASMVFVVDLNPIKWESSLIGIAGQKDYFYTNNYSFLSNNDIFQPPQRV